MVNAEIAVAMAVTIKNPAYSEVRGVIRFPQANEILSSNRIIPRESRRGKLSRGIVLLHNARPHTARQTQTLLREQFHGDIFEHPPYSSYLASSDFFLLSKLKEHLAGKRSKMVNI